MLQQHGNQDKSVFPDMLLQHFKPKSIFPDMLQRFKQKSVFPDMLLQHFKPNLVFSWYVAATYKVKLRKWLRGLGKTLLMGGVQCFLPLSMDLGPSHAYRIPILQKESIWLSFSSHRTIIYKSPPHIGGCHFLLCQHTSKKDIAGQSAGSGDDAAYDAGSGDEYGGESHGGDD